MIVVKGSFSLGTVSATPGPCGDLRESLSEACAETPGFRPDISLVPANRGQSSRGFSGGKLQNRLPGLSRGLSEDFLHQTADLD